MSTLTRVEPKEGTRDSIGNTPVAWDGLSDGAEAGWQPTRGSRAFVHVLGDFGVVELEGKLGGDVGVRIAAITKAQRLWYIHAVPAYVRPVLKGGERVTVLIYFMRP